MTCIRHKILYSAAELHALHTRENVLVVDCRFALDDPGAGFALYLDAHIPGAVYAHLDNDLSGPVSPATGRHPLPDGEKFAGFLSRLGWWPGMLMVVYDNMGGAIAARLWWLMKYFGHDGAAMLDGGMPAWTAAGLALESGQVHVDQSPLADYQEQLGLNLTTEQVADALQTGSIVLADARAPERFNGEVEPIDRLAGHIPGAVNYPFNSSLGSDGLFKSAREVRRGMEKMLDQYKPEQLVNMCGSGVTACHNIFSAELAGLNGSRLYVGSWSEWIQDPGRPIET